MLGKQPLGILFAAPYAVFLAAVFAYPLGLAVWICFHDYFFAAPGAEVDRPFVGLANYTEVLGDPDVQRAFLNVAEFLVINVPLTVVLSLVLATALNSVTRFRTFLRVSYYVPYVTASVALVAVWLFLFSKDGMVNQLLGPLAPDPSWLVNSELAMPVIALFVTWKQLGFFDPALPRRAAERVQGPLRVGRRRRCRPGEVVHEHHGARRPLGDHAGGDPRDDHRRQPVHRALPAHQRWRPGRRVRVAGVRDVPEGHRAGAPRHRGRHRRGAGDPRAAHLPASRKLLERD